MLTIDPFSLIEQILTNSSIEHGEAEVVAVNDPFIETHYAVRIYPILPRGSYPPSSPDKKYSHSVLTITGLHAQV